MNPETEDRMDHWLDAALARYGEAEPLGNLEDRVLARLELAKREGRRRGRLGAAVGAVACLALAGLLLRPTPVRVERTGQTTATQRTGKKSATPEESTLPTITRRRPAVVETKARPVRQPAEAVAPKLAQFPAPTPATAEELLLYRYLAGTPRAEVVAQAMRPHLQLPEDPWSPPSTATAPSSEQK